jgi:tRNA modification GTPase
MSTGPDTIVAVATPRGRGAIGIIRLSGPSALPAARGLASRFPPSPSRVTPTGHRSWTGRASSLDEGLVLYFLPESSVTGEAVVELHSHGSPTVQSLLLQALLDVEGVRLAEPGEFTERAFLNGRVDLARAEAVADLIAAEGEASLRAAASQLAGALGDAVRAVRGPLLDLQADLDAVLDFPEEAAEAEAGIAPRLTAARESVASLLATAARGRVLRRGARVVLAGPVNAGKSSLFNRLVGEERALVDAEPGTTRDILEAPGDLDGLSVTWVDTAGLGGTPGRVEAMGVERTLAALQGADVVVRVVPAGMPGEQRARWRAELTATVAIDVASKADLAAPSVEEGLTFRLTGEGVKARTGAEILRAGAMRDDRGQTARRGTSQAVQALGEAMAQGPARGARRRG